MGGLHEITHDPIFQKHRGSNDSCDYRVSAVLDRDGIDFWRFDAGHFSWFSTIEISMRVESGVEGQDESMDLNNLIFRIIETNRLIEDEQNFI